MKELFFYPDKPACRYCFNEFQMTKIKFIITYIIVLSILACSDVQERSPITPKYHFSLRLTQGQKFYFNLVNEVRNNIEVNNKEMETSSTADIGLLYEVLKDSAGIYTIKITYDKIRISMKDDKGEQEMDSDKAATSFNAVEKLLGNLKGASLIITVDKTGKISGISGGKELVDRILSGTPSGDAYSKQAAQQLMSQFAGDIFVNNNLSQGLNIFPDSAVYVGDTWSKEYVQKADITFKADAKYTLASIKNGHAEVEMTSDIANAGPQQSNVLGYQVSSDMKGTQSGNIKIDTLSGLPVSEKSLTSISGMVQVMGRKLPIKLTFKKEMSAKRL